MEALEIRDKYREFFEKKNYSHLREVPVCDKNGDSFIGSALTPNIGYLENSEKNNNEFMFTQQRVFWTRYLDDINCCPTWSIFQVMMSFYQLNQSDMQLAYENAYKLLIEEFRLPKDDIYIVTNNNKYVNKSLDSNNFNKANIIKWEKEIKFEVKNKLNGFYNKILLKYRNGVIPLFDLIKIDGDNDLINIDSCLILERITFILQNKRTMYDTNTFLPLVREISNQSKFNNILDCYETANLMRAVVCAIGDGADVSNNKNGYMLKKVIRKMINRNIEKNYNLNYSKLIESSLECLANIGYNYLDEKEQIESVLENEEKRTYKLYYENIKFIEKQIKRYKDKNICEISGKDIELWRDSRGIPEDISHNIIISNGIKIKEYNKKEIIIPGKFGDGYLYDESKKILNVASWLKEKEFI